MTAGRYIVSAAALICMLFPAPGTAQWPHEKRTIYPKRTILGFGGNYSKYTTKWSIADNVPLGPDLANAPVHIHEVVNLVLFTENRAQLNMQKLKLDFLILTGDTVYLDSESPRARTVELARYHWQRMYSLPRHVEFHRHVPGYWEVDDHDAWVNDCWPTMRARWMNPLTISLYLQ